MTDPQSAEAVRAGDARACGPGAAPRETCNSCGHEAPPDEMIRELKFNWTPTGNKVCRDPDACFTRWLARQRKDDGR